MRSERLSVFRIGLLSNRTMNKAFLAGLVLQLSVLLIPALQPAFHITVLTAVEWLAVIGLSLVPLAVSETVKATDRAGEKT